jgi:hypothetical protein
MRLTTNIVEKGSFDYVRFGLLSFGTIYVASGLAAQLGMWLENLVNGYQPLSYLRLNRGDEQVIRSYEKSTKSRSIKAVISCLLAIGLNIAASWLAIRFGIH